jgi:hypothetical protein
MKVGFTGSREGMSEEQEVAIVEFITKLTATVTEFHHGDCVGADERAHGLIYDWWGERIKRVIHPPEDESLRAFCDGDETRKPKPYLIRNHNIVDETDVLIATPRHDSEEMRSGTWATVRYAGQQGKPIYIVYADGRVDEENNKAAVARY